VVRSRDREILIDPGTYTYVGDPAAREAFRGSAAHNTIRIDGRDQAIPAGPFRWREKPAVQIHEWSTARDRDVLEASCVYAGFTHRRRIVFHKPRRVVIADTVEGPPGDHTIEQFWHLGSIAEARHFRFGVEAEMIEGWRSRAFASREKAPVLRVTVTARLPLKLETVVDL
jgi:hypothetical protein